MENVSQAFQVKQLVLFAEIAAARELHQFNVVNDNNMNTNKQQLTRPDNIFNWHER